MARQDNFITDNMERIEMFRSLQLRLATSAHCLLGFGWTGRELWRHLTAAAQAQLACWNTQTAWQYPGETNQSFLSFVRFQPEQFTVIPVFQHSFESFRDIMLMVITMMVTRKTMMTMMTQKL